jgi:hypothetical protein
LVMTSFQPKRRFSSATTTLLRRASGIPSGSHQARSNAGRQGHSPSRPLANLCECKALLSEGNVKTKLMMLTPPELRTLWVQCGTALETR